MGEGGEVGQAEEVGAEDDGAVGGRVGVEVREEGRGADAVAEPGEFFVGGDGVSAVDALLDGEEGGDVAVVDGEEVDVEAVLPDVSGGGCSPR